MNLSLQWNGSQVGGKRNVSSKRKSDFERPVTVDYKSKQLCAKCKIFVLTAVKIFVVFSCSEFFQLPTIISFQV